MLTYDAWGRVCSITGSKASTLGVLNPIRYRGYVYDTETELYYLQSRYYNPEWGRFINADALVSTGQGVLGNNMFAYCLNNPANMVDTEGTIPTIIEYYFYHKIVQMYIVDQYGFAMEVYVKTGEKRGFLDLYDPSSNSFYELKSIGVTNSQWALSKLQDQVMRYAASTILGSMLDDYEIEGSPTPGTKNISGSFTLGSKWFKFRTVAPGVIMYTVIDLDGLKEKAMATEEQFANAKAIVIAGAIVGCLVMGGAIRLPSYGEFSPEQSHN